MVQQSTPMVSISVHCTTLRNALLYAKIGFSMVKVTLEFSTICIKVFYLVETRGYMFTHNEFCYVDHKLLACAFGTIIMMNLDE